MLQIEINEFVDLSFEMTCKTINFLDSSNFIGWKIFIILARWNSYFQVLIIQLLKFVFSEGKAVLSVEHCFIDFAKW